MENFDSFQLPPALKTSLTRMGFTVPTPIQAQAIQHALEGKDVLGTAQTGTGKTGAFSIPIVAKLLQSTRGSALILTPTRELATQVMDVVTKLLGERSAIKAAILIGGEPMGRQINQLRLRPRIIVGTPGRINDHLEQGNLMLLDTSTLVLDETDRMLDMGFSVQIDRILKFLPKQRQTMLFSATLPPEILKLSKQYLNDPVRIAVGNANMVAPKILQETINTTIVGKHEALCKELDKREGSIIVFVKTKWGAEKLADKLDRSGYSADAIHGDLQQRQRDRVITNFRNKKHRILVATDIAARGLDIPHIEHVINFDLPMQPEDYIHRIGRTARAGAEGSAVSLLLPEDGKKWNAIRRLLDPTDRSLDVAPTGNDGNRGPRKGKGGFRGKRTGQGGGGGYQGGGKGQGEGGQRNTRPRRGKPQGASTARVA